MKKITILTFISLILIFNGCANPDAIDQTLHEATVQELEMAELRINDLNDMVDEKTSVIEGLNWQLDEKMKMMDDLHEQLDKQKSLLEEKEEEVESLMMSGPTSGASLLTEAVNIIHLLDTNDFSNLALYVDPTDGLRLTPYQYVDLSNDIVLTQSQVSDWTTVPLMTWGSYDGTGDPINLNGMDYYNSFVYDEDYLNAPYIGQNTVLSSGNMINNITTVYPGASYVEFYFDSFNPAYSGMDWSSLTLVMKNVGGQWYLIGLVNGQWTI